MKKLFLVIVLLVVIGLSTHTTAATDPSTNPAPPANFELTETIDNIAVPYDVLLDAQMKYPAHAVMAASKTSRDGQDLYRLRLDSSDQHSSRLHIYLLFSTDWKYAGEETAVSPAPKPKPEEQQPAPEQPEQPQPDQELGNEAEAEDEPEEPDEDEPLPPPVDSGDPRPSRRNRPGRD